MRKLLIAVFVFLGMISTTIAQPPPLGPPLLPPHLDSCSLKIYSVEPLFEHGQWHGDTVWCSYRWNGTMQEAYDVSIYVAPLDNLYTPLGWWFMNDYQFMGPELDGDYCGIPCYIPGIESWWQPIGWYSTHGYKVRIDLTRMATGALIARYEDTYIKINNLPPPGY